jgi:hypothetical protein
MRAASPRIFTVRSLVYYLRFYVFIITLGCVFSGLKLLQEFSLVAIGMKPDGILKASA